MTAHLPTPLIILFCAHCGAEMPRSIARGLWIGDGMATVMPGWSQECDNPKCEHVHKPGDVLRYRLGKSAVNVSR